MLRQVKALVQAIRRLAAGDLSSRAGFNEAEEELRQTRDQLQAALDAIPAAVSWISSDLTYMGLNRYLAEALCISRETFIGQKVGFQGTSPELVEFARDFFASPAQEDVREIKSHIGSSTRHYLMVARKYAAGQASVFVGMDITAHRQAEEALVQEHNLLRTLIDNMPDYIYVKDAESRFLLGNMAVARVMGAGTPADLLGKTDFDFHPSELAAQYYADERELITSGRSLINRQERVEEPLGDVKWTLTSKVPLRDRHGQVIGLVGIGRDITERVQAEEAIRKLNAELEQRVIERTVQLTAANQELAREIVERMRAEEEAKRALAKEQELNDLKSRFISMASHEFRTPLSIILSTTQLLEEYNHMFSEEKKRGHLRRIQAAVKQMTDLLENVLTVSRTDAGWLTLTPARLDLVLLPGVSRGTSAHGQDRTQDHVCK